MLERAHLAIWPCESPVHAVGLWFAQRGLLVLRGDTSPVLVANVPHAVRVVRERVPRVMVAVVGLLVALRVVHRESRGRWLLDTVLLGEPIETLADFANCQVFRLAVSTIPNFTGGLAEGIATISGKGVPHPETPS